MKRKKVFFLPYAGGSSMNYQSLFGCFSDEIEPIGLELAGRGKRYGEEFYASVDEAANDMMRLIRDDIDTEDYAIFGHSMGATIAFELYYQIEAMGLKLPKCLFISGRPSPNSFHQKINIMEYDDETFIKLISLYGGLPQEFENHELRSILLPVLRADFKMLDEYVYQEKENKIKSELIVLCGESDFSANKVESLKWEDFSEGRFTIYTFAEGHFFINEHIEEIAQIIEERM